MPNRLRRLLLTLLAWSAGVEDGAAQWRVEASLGGLDTPAVASELGSSSVILGVARLGRSWLQFASGLPIDSGGPLWASGRTGTELVRHAAVDLGIAPSAEGWLYRRHDRSTGGGALLQVHPFGRIHNGTSALELRSGAVHYLSRGDHLSASRTLSSTSLLASSYRGVWSTAAEVRYVAGADGTFTYAGGVLGLRLPFGSISGLGGKWLTEDIPRAEWSVAAQLDLTHRMHLEAALRQMTNDPIFWSEPRRIWSFGLSYELTPPLSRPVPILLETASPEVRLSLPVAEYPEPPTVAGDFTGWKPVPMVQEGDLWVVALPMKPGIYHFSFRSSKGEWFLPDSIANRVDDGFGGENGILVVQ